MLRRTFIAGCCAVVASATLPSHAASGFIDYRPGVIEQALAQGKTVFVDYKAAWCVTCEVQSRVIGDLLNENPAYRQAMTFISVDWDVYGRQPVSTDRNIPRRSTLIVLRGDRELGRVVAGTSKSAIQALLDLGLQADG